MNKSNLPNNKGQANIANDSSIINAVQINQSIDNKHTFEIDISNIDISEENLFKIIRLLNELAPVYSV